MSVWLCHCVWLIESLLVLHVLFGQGQSGLTGNRGMVLGFIESFATTILSPYNQQSCDRWCHWVWISVPTLPFPESAVPDNGKVGNPVRCPHPRCYTPPVFWVSFRCMLIVSPVRSTYGGYYGLVVVPPRPRPRPQTLHRSHDNLKNPCRIASIFYM